MKHLLILPLIVILFCCSNTTKQKAEQTSCEWCGATEAPKNVSWQTTIADESEEGQRLKITGSVYKKDGTTPAAGVILYLYHTNAKGIYPKKGDESGNGKRHGYLRGWVKTNQSGKYSFETIKPAAYPGRTEPAHIHITVKEPTKEEYWLSSYLFEGDELITKKDRERTTSDERFNHVISLKKENGILIGQRDILLKN